MKKSIILMLFYAVFSVNAMEKRDTRLTSHDVRTAESLVMFSRAAHEEKPEKRRKMIDTDKVGEEPVKLYTQKCEKVPFACSVCGKIFDIRSKCERHERTHQKLKPFKCRFCGRAYTTKHSRDVHEFVHEE